jgi:hypothetical protein
MVFIPPCCHVASLCCDRGIPTMKSITIVTHNSAFDLSEPQQVPSKDAINHSTQELFNPLTINTKPSTTGQCNAPEENRRKRKHAKARHADGSCHLHRE